MRTTAALAGRWSPPLTWGDASLAAGGGTAPDGTGVPSFVLRPRLGIDVWPQGLQPTYQVEAGAFYSWRSHAEGGVGADLDVLFRLPVLDPDETFLWLGPRASIEVPIRGDQSPFVALWLVFRFDAAVSSHWGD